MSRDAALRSAISLLSVPTQVRAMRAAPLPEGTLLLLSVAAEEEDAVAEAAQLTGRPRETLVNAAAFFIEQILLGPESDSYRVLGAEPGTPAQELRAHMALLMRWLHPDVNAGAQKALYVGRVTRAWEDLKTAERRHAYDAGRDLHASGTAVRRRPAGRRPQLEVVPLRRGWIMSTLARLLHKSKS